MIVRSTPAAHQRACFILISALIKGDVWVAGAREYAVGRGAIYDTAVCAAKGPTALTPQPDDRLIRAAGLPYQRLRVKRLLVPPHRIQDAGQAPGEGDDGDPRAAPVSHPLGPRSQGRGSRRRQAIEDPGGLHE